MKDSYLDTHPQAKHRVWNLESVTLEKVHDVEFNETKGSQDENENLKDVRGIQLSNAIKNIDVGELRPRQVKCKCSLTQLCKLIQIKQV
jgi:hypothetical protein